MADNKPTINDLYRHVFQAMDDLSAKKISVEHANAMANLATAAVNAGKLECKFIDTIGGHGTGFMPDKSEGLPSRDRLRLVNRWNSRPG